MPTKKLLLLIVCLSLVSELAQARIVKIPLPITYDLIEKAVLAQFYSGADGIAHIWHDKKNCNAVDLTEPGIAGQEGQIQIENSVAARLGTALGKQCIPLLSWQGRIATLHQPELSVDGSVLKFPVTRVNATDANGRSVSVGQIEALLKRFVEPKLGNLQIDLNQSRPEIVRTLTRYVPPQNQAAMTSAIDTLKFDAFKAGPQGLSVDVSIDVPEELFQRVKAEPAPAFTETEIKQWQASSHKLDNYFTDIVGRAYQDSHSAEIQARLKQILTQAHTVFEQALRNDHNAGPDPVRLFFTETWAELTPILKQVADDVPGADGLRYLTWIAGADVLYELENNLGVPFGLDISTDGLRRLARRVIDQGR